MSEIIKEVDGKIVKETILGDKADYLAEKRIELREIDAEIARQEKYLEEAKGRKALLLEHFKSLNEEPESPTKEEAAADAPAEKK